MHIRDISFSDMRVWIKPEWSPLSDGWPAVSFTHLTVATNLSNEFRMDRDLMISVGTTNAKEVKKQYRSKLLSVSRFASQQAVETSKIVPPESWAAAQSNYPDQWAWGFPINDLWEFDPFIDAHDVIPNAYRKFAHQRGMPIELEAKEITQILDLTITKQALNHTANALAAIDQQSMSESDSEVRKEIARVATLISQRVAGSGQDISRIMPFRSTSPEIDLQVSLWSLWKKQEGICPLCHGKIEIQPSNKLLQMSVDRIDSGCGAYDQNNMHITHFGCNLAKNKFSSDEFHDWLKTAAANYSKHAD
jgi:hypothetical protein